MDKKLADDFCGIYAFSICKEKLRGGIFMDTVLNFVRFILVGGLLVLVLTNSRKDTSPQRNRRLYGLVGILISASYMLGFIVQDAFLASSQIVLWLGPAVGGLLLIIVSYLSKLQGNVVEYVAWALVSTSVIAFTYTFSPPVWVQWGGAIVADVGVPYKIRA